MQFDLVIDLLVILRRPRVAGRWLYTRRVVVVQWYLHTNITNTGRLQVPSTLHRYRNNQWCYVLEANILASASTLWSRPRPQTVSLGLASISLSYYVIGHFCGKNRVKFGNFNFSGNNLKSYVVNHYLVLFFIIIFGLGLNLRLGLVALASASASRFWPRLTSLVTMR